MAETTIHVLLIEDEEYDVRRVRNTIALYKGSIEIVTVVSNGRSALETMTEKKDGIDVVIMDMQIAGGLKGEDLIREIKSIAPTVQIIVITKMTINITDFEFADRLMRAGAYWYCTKYPSDIEAFIYQPTDFIISVVNAYQKRRLETEQRRTAGKLLRNVADKLAQRQMIGTSVPMERLRVQITQCAESDATVLITGPSGTGKELVATNIHYASRRKLENFLPLNCGGIPNDLIESELFGYEKGAFTGANTNRAGLFEAANKGTLFLDEIGELPLSAQVKLLRVIQEGEIQKIGRAEKSKVDVRIIAATNKDLDKEVKEGRFREDLYYRLNVIPIYVPPLRERAGDIPVFWDYYVRAMSVEMSMQPPVTESAALALLTRYEWPGNVRELKNIVQRLLFMTKESITVELVESALYPGRLRPSSAQDDGITFQQNGDLLQWRQMERVLREKYFRYVRAHSDSDADAAKKLGLAPPNYHRMSKELGLKS